MSVGDIYKDMDQQLVSIVRLLEAWWPQLKNCWPYIAAWKLLVILILRKTWHCIARCGTVLKIACNSNSKKDKKRHDIALHCKMCHCTEVRFASFFSSGFVTLIVVNHRKGSWQMHSDSDLDWIQIRIQIQIQIRIQIGFRLDSDQIRSFSLLYIWSNS